MSKKVTEYLKYELTNEETLELAKNQARGLQELRALEAKKSEISKKLGADIEEKKAEISKVCDLISQGYEWRNIECTLRFDTPQRGIASLIRLDTGEVVRERRMTEEELQQELEFTPVAEEAPIVAEEPLGPPRIFEGKGEEWEARIDIVDIDLKLGWTVTAELLGGAKVEGTQQADLQPSISLAVQAACEMLAGWAEFQMSDTDKQVRFRAAQLRAWAISIKECNGPGAKK